MKRKLCIGSIVCLVSLIWSGLEAEAQDIKYLLKTGHLKPHQAFFQAPLSPQLSDQTYLLSVTDSESEARKEMLRREAEKPPLKGGQVAGEILNGVVGEFLGMIGGMLPGAVLGGVLVWFSPPIGATIGFNLTRRYKSPPTSETALINFSDGQMRLEVPQISFYLDRYASKTPNAH